MASIAGSVRALSHPSVSAASQPRPTAAALQPRPMARPTAPAWPSVAAAAAATSAPAAPRTGFHTAPEELVAEALSLFFPDCPADKLTLSATTGGVNNVMQYVETPDGTKYLLRIYNNGRKPEKAEFEHAVLAQLNAGPALSFQVPKALPSRNGRNHEQLADGSDACVFFLIPGSLARTTTPREVGRAAGELTRAMARVQVDHMKPPIAPYYDLYRVHHASSREVFMEDMASPAMDACREAADALLEELMRLEDRLLSRAHEMDLPQQLIHGDVHYDNVLATPDDRVSGILDFEFVARDWRVMELAVCLSKYVGDAEPLPLVEDFIQGYMMHAELTADEMAVVPDCINLRILSNAVYFVGRARAGEDSIESLTSRAGAYAKRVRWVRDNADAIVASLKKATAAAKAA